MRECTEKMINICTNIALIFLLFTKKIKDIMNKKICENELIGICFFIFARTRDFFIYIKNKMC